MDIDVRKLAELFWEEAYGKSEREVDALSKRFSEFLAKKRITHLAEPIASQLVRIRDAQEGRGRAAILVSRALSVKERLRLEENLKQRYGFKNIHIEEKVEPEALGGIAVTVGWERFDGTLAGKLNRLKQTML
jgi:F-type H+-transporting ATPase subunit delta